MFKKLVVNNFQQHGGQTILISKTIPFEMQTSLGTLKRYQWISLNLSTATWLSVILLYISFTLIFYFEEIMVTENVVYCRITQYYITLNLYFLKDIHKM